MGGGLSRRTPLSVRVLVLSAVSVLVSLMNCAFRFHVCYVFEEAKCITTFQVSGGEL